MTSRKYLFTSESVSEGHPDKLADQISDAILDAYMAQDPSSRVAAETLCAGSLVVLAGEVSSRAMVDCESIARGAIAAAGYSDGEWGISPSECEVRLAYGAQSADIAMGVDASAWGKPLGAGDQGLMFGYACDETPELMPAPIAWAHALCARQASLRKSGAFPWLRPDAKAQVTVEYEGSRPIRIATVVLSTQHAPEASPKMVEEACIDEIIKKALPQELLAGARFLVNPTGRFVIGGPKGDAGLTGRKIIVDTYGGSCPHGGGAFSGKDPTKVDRSAAYGARRVAKCVVASGLASRCQLQLGYAIGVAEPVSVSLSCFGTQKVPEHLIEEAAKELFDLTPSGLIREMDLARPIYARTAAYGHFGREGFPWEDASNAAALRALAEAKA